MKNSMITYNIKNISFSILYSKCDLHKIVKTTFAGRST